MRKRLCWGLMVLLLIMLAGNPFVVSAAGDMMDISDNYVANDWQCIPFQRVGPITPITTVDELVQMFGKENVLRRTVPGAEGAEHYDVSVIYPNTPNELNIFWKNNRYGSAPQSVSVRQAGTAWKTVYGITVGTSLEELNQINGKPFVISGFGWDYGGYVASWSDGTLAPVKGLILRLHPAWKLPRNFYGDGVKVNSGDFRLLPDAVKVGEFSVTLEKVVFFPACGKYESVERARTSDTGELIDEPLWTLDINKSCNYYGTLSWVSKGVWRGSWSAPLAIAADCNGKYPIDVSGGKVIELEPTSDNSFIMYVHFYKNGDHVFNVTMKKVE